MINKQRERQQRGSNFQEEIRHSLRLVPNLWTINITDGRGGSRPADRIIITEKVNILAELKRTAGRRFNLSFLRPNQLQGLIDFDRVIKRNYGLVFINFHDLKNNIDEAYAFRLITALKFMRQKGVRFITIDEFRNKKIPAIHLPRKKDYYDLRGVVNCMSL